jgi:tetratricopeptide (TPR) repeat protein
VLAARSEAQLGKYTEAWERFDRARALSPSSVESPGALHDLAVAALRTGHIEQAADAYRVLAPRVELIDDERERVRVLVEGGVLAMRRGPEHLGEAIGYLNEARRAGSPLGLGDYVIAALSLAYARQGRESDAMGVVDESSGPWRLEAEREREGQAGVSSLPALPAGELDAMIAILSERRDKDLALERLQSYLVSVPSGPFAAWTRARREALLHARKAAR